MKRRVGKGWCEDREIWRVMRNEKGLGVFIEAEEECWGRKGFEI
jgi:hypothetical protein